MNQWQPSDEECSDEGDDLLGEQVGRLINDVVRLGRDLREVLSRLATLELHVSRIVTTSHLIPVQTSWPEESSEPTDCMTPTLL